MAFPSLTSCSSKSTVWGSADELIIEAFLSRIPTAHLNQDELQYLKHVGVVALFLCRNRAEPLAAAVVRNWIRGALLQALQAIASQKAVPHVGTEPH